MEGNSIMKLFEVIVIENNDPILEAGVNPSNGCANPFEGCAQPDDGCTAPEFPTAPEEEV